MSPGQGGITRRRWLQAGPVLVGLPRKPARASDGPALSITGDVRQPLRLGVRDLADFPAAGQAESRVVRQVDGQGRETLSRGVRLKALLQRAALAERDRLDWRRTIVMAIAADGYRAVFSWPELFNTDTGNLVLVLYQRDGMPLSDGEGPLALLAAADLRLGPRHVKQLVRLDVRILDEVPPGRAPAR